MLKPGEKHDHFTVTKMNTKRLAGSQTLARLTEDATAEDKQGLADMMSQGTARMQAVNKDVDGAREE